MNDPHLHSAKGLGKPLLPARRALASPKERERGAKVTGAAAPDFLQPPGMRWRWRVRLNRGRGVSLLAPAASRLEPPLRLASLSCELPTPPLNRHFEKIIPPPPSSLFAHQQTAQDKPPRMDGVLCAPHHNNAPCLPLLSDLYNCDSSGRWGGGLCNRASQSPRGLPACLLSPP